MKNARAYMREDDGTVWTQIEGLYRRPATAEELEGYCLEIRDAADRPVEDDRVLVAA